MRLNSCCQYVEFVAIDEEMTAISLPGFEEQIADSPAERYGKMRTVLELVSTALSNLAWFFSPKMRWHGSTWFALSISMFLLKRVS